MQRFRSGPLLAIKLEAGEDLMSSLVQLAKEEKVEAGFVTSGIGMLRGSRVGYFIGDRYDERTYEGPHELLSLQGSIATRSGEPHIHLHGALANRSHDVVGGHLFEATVHVVCEMLVTVFEGKSFKRTDSGPVLKLLDLMPDSG